MLRQQSTEPQLRPAAFGFTLVEILVVIVIMGIAAAAVTLSFGLLGHDQEVEDQAQRLWAVLTQAKEESELQGRNVGVIVDQTGYEFVQFDARRWAWIPITEDDLLYARQLPPGLFITLSLDGRQVVLQPHSERLPDADDEKNPDAQDSDKQSPLKPKTLQDAKMAPHIMLLASGDVSSFDLRLKREEEEYSWHVNSKPDNSIEVGQVDATL